MRARTRRRRAEAMRTRRALIFTRARRAVARVAAPWRAHGRELDAAGQTRQRDTNSPWRIRHSSSRDGGRVDVVDGHGDDGQDDIAVVVIDAVAGRARRRARVAKEARMHRGRFLARQAFGDAYGACDADARGEARRRASWGATESVCIA